jgi:hypothetical protein
MRKKGHSRIATCRTQLDARVEPRGWFEGAGSKRGSSRGGGSRVQARSEGRVEGVVRGCRLEARVEPRAWFEGAGSKRGSSRGRGSRVQARSEARLNVLSHRMACAAHHTGTVWAAPRGRASSLQGAVRGNDGPHALAAGCVPVRAAPAPRSKVVRRMSRLWFRGSWLWMSAVHAEQARVARAVARAL